MQNPESLHGNIQKYVDLPWYALKPYDRDILSAEPKPLSESQIDELIDNLTGNNPEKWPLVEKLHDENADLLKSTKSVAIILDGSSKNSKEGYLGDMIEATRLINTLRTAGKKVVIITPHDDLFQGTTDSSVSILPLPEEAQSSHIAPWRRELLDYLHDSIGDMPCVFPMNATMPALIRVGKGGLIENNDTLMLTKNAFGLYEKKIGIRPTRWGSAGIHQLQAFQTITYLLGIDSARKWQEFPSAFLHPAQSAKETAAEVTRIYGCFDKSTYGEDCPPLYLHPGVATNGSKIRTKFYPEDKWIDFIHELTATRDLANSLTFLEPTDPEQGAMTLRLATAAVEAGLRVAKVPMSQIKQRYEWTLGSFVAFLQELSNNRGVIVGCDSMPAGHAGPSTDNPTIVLGNLCFDPGFYCPSEKALVVLPSKGNFTSGIVPERIVTALIYACLDPNLQYHNKNAGKS